METLRRGLVIVLTLGVIAVQAQSVEEIVSKHINALGGKDVLDKMKTVYVESSVSFAGNPVSAISSTVFGKGSRTDVDFGGQKFIQTVSEKGGWMVAPGQNGATALPDEMVKASKMQYESGGALYNYASKGSKVVFLGKDTSGGGSYKLGLTTKDSISVTFYINVKTYLIDKAINKMSVNGQDMLTTAIYSDYRKTDVGYVVAWTQQVILPQVTMDIKNTKVEVNKDIDEGIFEMPKN